MNQNPDHNKNSQRSEIFISYSRQQLQTMDFDPTKPQMYLNQKQGEKNQNKVDQQQQNNMSNNQLTDNSYQRFQAQNDVMKTEKNQQGTPKQNFNQYKTQEEDHEIFIQNNTIQKKNNNNLSSTTPFTNENWINTQGAIPQQNQTQFNQYTGLQNSFQQK
ncbi:unnamed protein product [Paramecium sonneborni]|uniref:Uncharacterized protein n=1 Tax=Paramecium sonneborni TaxID=65129 RepID=A0A8S1R473_9CILI|nr:unnamed protein product [Paramecium sonneborni]